MTLILAKSFVKLRDATELGVSKKNTREWDFTDVEIIDKKKESAQTLTMLKFLSALKQSAIVLKPVVVN